MPYDLIPVADLPKTREAALALWEQVRIAGEREGPEASRAYAGLLGRSDLFLLLVFLLRMPWINNDWLFDRCREVQASPDGHLDLWARGHAKTNIITIGLTVQDILNDPEITVSIFSHVRSISKDILSKIKREFEDNAQLKYVYSDVLWAEPKREAPRWSEDNGLIVKRRANPKEATLEAHGLVDGMPTGKHFDLRIYDDVVTQASCTTSEQIQKTTDAWDLSQNLGISGGGKVRYIGTRYNLGDSYATMIERGAVVPRIYPATHDGRMTGRPVFLSDEAWANTLRNSSRSIIASQQLQNPLADEDASFSPEWLRTFNVRPRHLNIYITCDPSAGRSASSDNTAIAVIGMGSTGHLYSAWRLLSSNAAVGQVDRAFGAVSSMVADGGRPARRGGIRAVRYGRRTLSIFRSAWILRSARAWRIHTSPSQNSRGPATAPAPSVRGWNGWSRGSGTDDSCCRKRWCVTASRCGGQCSPITKPPGLAR